jgi:hypothetical protein
MRSPQTAALRDDTVKFPTFVLPKDLVQKSKDRELEDGRRATQLPQAAQWSGHVISSSAHYCLAEHSETLARLAFVPINLDPIHAREGSASFITHASDSKEHCNAIRSRMGTSTHLQPARHTSMGQMQS